MRKVDVKMWKSIASNEQIFHIKRGNVFNFTEKTGIYPQTKVCFRFLWKIIHIFHRMHADYKRIISRRLCINRKADR